MRLIARIVAASALAVTATGCQYYSISGAESPKGHITHNWRCWRQKDTARFIDLKTGEEVRLTSAVVQPIPADEATAEIAAAAEPPRVYWWQRR